MIKIFITILFASIIFLGGQINYTRAVVDSGEAKNVKQERDDKKYTNLKTQMVAPPKTTDILKGDPISVNNLLNNTKNTATNNQTTIPEPKMQPSHEPYNLGNNNISKNATVKVSECVAEGLEGVKFLFFHGPLVPCGIVKKCDTSKITDDKVKKRIEGLSKPCTLCHFIILIKNIFDLLLSMIFIVAILMLTVAGVLYIISGGGSMTSLAKGIIQKTLIGFGIFLLSWLLVYTLLNMLSVRKTVLGKGSSDSWFQFECDTESSFYTLSKGANIKQDGVKGGGTGTGGAGGGTGTGVNTGGNPNVTPPSTATPEGQARAALFEDSGGNISVWESATGATNVRDLKLETKERLIAFQKEASIPLTVNGGAEEGYHAGDNNTTAQSHVNGYKVDIDDTTLVNNYIENNYTYIGYRTGRNGGRVYTDGHGNYYTREDTHWDVCYNCNAPAISTVH